MERIKNLRWLMGILAALALAAATLWTKPFGKDEAMNTDSINTGVRTLCVGRYLIDVPATYKFEHYSYRIDGVNVTWLFKATDLSSFNVVLDERKAELMAQRNDYDESSLEEPKKVAVNKISIVILPYGRINPIYLGQKDKVRNPESDRYLEAWVWTGKRGYKFDGKDLGPGAEAKELVRRIEPLLDLEDKTVPTDDGFCMEMFDARAMIAGPPRAPDTYEGAEIQFGLKDHADVKFRLSFYPNLNDKLDEPLSARQARTKSNRGAEANRVTELREAPRSVRGMEGYQLVEAFREQNGTRGINFDWEWLGRIKDPLAPQIEFEAKTGYSNEGPVDSSLSDAAALKLWDALVDSIRLRPVKTGKTSQAERPTPLGELVATGRPCPHTGWWECVEQSAPVQGGQRQFFRQGEPMPEAVLLGKPSLMQRVKGEAPAFRTATVWKLVGDKASMPAQDSATRVPVPAQARSTAAVPPAAGVDAPGLPPTNGANLPADKA